MSYVLEISGVPTIFYFLIPDGLTLAFCFYLLKRKL